MQHRSMAALTLVQAASASAIWRQLLDKLTHLLMLEQMSGQQITVLVNYYALRQGLPKILRTLLYGLAQRVPQHGGLLMTLAETWLAEGMEKGIREGVQQGIKKGNTRLWCRFARSDAQSRY
ncbi:hypothetical protein LNP74_14045 [Klebsiella pneumoniae subsp. pneumoniae]|nr:hypothetical protein [Klebsiella pneumoniae subsp. pneumoniae]